MRTLFVFFAVTAGLGALGAAFGQGSASRVAAGHLAAGQVAAGRAIALDLCTPCHVVAKDQPSEPILVQRTPSFEEIASRPHVSAKSLRRFVTTTHWDEKTVPITMPGPMLEPSQVDDVTAYILSLRTKPKS